MSAKTAGSMSPHDQPMANLMPPGNGSRRGSSFLQTGQRLLVPTQAVGPKRRMSIMQRKNTRTGLGHRGSVHSVSDASFGQGPLVTMENTYRTEPEDDQGFSSCKAERVIYQALERHLSHVKYDASNSPQLTCSVAQYVKDELRQHLNCVRHKLVCHVVLGQGKDNCLEFASRCLWSPDTDSSATASYRSSDIFAVATVFALYFD